MGSRFGALAQLQATVAAVLIAGLAFPASSPGQPAPNEPPVLDPIVAGFDEGSHTTFYAITATDPEGQPLTYTWSLQPPPAEPNCNQFVQEANVPSGARWMHGEENGCPNPDPHHAGVISLAVSDGSWVCAASYTGTQTGTGPAPQNGRAACARPGDRDKDGVPDPSDNCPDTPNPDQVNTDGDSQGNACDDNDDNDKFNDQDDDCPLEHGGPDTTDGCVPTFGLKTKRDMEKASKVIVIWSGVSAVTGVGVLVTPLAPLCPLFEGAAALGGVTAGVLDLLADDPPDPNFKVIAVPRPPRTPRLGSRVKGRLRVAALAYMRATGRLQGVLRALLTSVERAQGAQRAGDRGWQARQSAAAARYAREGAAILDRLAARRARMVRALGKANIVFTRRGFVRLQRRIARRGFPAAAQRALRRAGLTSAQIRALRRNVGALTPPRGRRSVASLLLNPALKRGEAAGAASLRQLARSGLFAPP